MTFRRLVPYLAFLAVFAMAIRPSIDTDTWWHLRAGDWMLQHRQILVRDEFSSTMKGSEWVYPGWLAQIAMSLVFDTAGAGGLSLFTTVAVLAGLAAVWSLLEGPLLLRAGVLLLSAAASAIYWSARPQILSFALTGITLWLLSRFERGQKASLWLLPVLLALWGNLHGGFAVGLILIGSTILAEILEMTVGDPSRGLRPADIWHSRKGRLLPLVGWALVAVLAVGLNPFGLEMLAYPWKTVAIPTLRTYVQEWQSPDFHAAATQPFLAMLVLLPLAVSASRKPMSAGEIVRGAGFTALALLAARNIAVFALVAAPILSRHLASGLERWEALWPPSRPLPGQVTRFVNLALAIVLTLAAGVWGSLQLKASALQAHIDRQIPSDAFEWLAGQPPAENLFHSYNWGGYVLWRLYPAYSSFVDGRTDVFSPNVLEEYIRAWTAGPGWQEVLDDHEIRTVLIEPSSPLGQVLTLAGWTAAYEDSDAVIFRRPAGE